MIKRRTLFLASAAFALKSSAKPTFAQAPSIPSVEETIQILRSEDSFLLALLSTNFALANAMANSILLNEPEKFGVSNADLVGLRFREIAPIDTTIQDTLESLLINADARANRASFILETVNRFGSNFEFLGSMIGFYTDQLRESGFGPDDPVVANAISSLTHVERITTPFLEENDGPYLCRVFPFKYFCAS